MIRTILSGVASLTSSTNLLRRHVDDLERIEPAGDEVQLGKVSRMRRACETAAIPHDHTVAKRELRDDFERVFVEKLQAVGPDTHSEHPVGR